MLRMTSPLLQDLKTWNLKEIFPMAKHQDKGKQNLLTTDH